MQYFEILRNNTIIVRWENKQFRLAVQREKLVRLLSQCLYISFTQFFIQVPETRSSKIHLEKMDLSSFTAKLQNYPIRKKS